MDMASDQGIRRDEDDIDDDLFSDDGSSTSSRNLSSMMSHGIDLSENFRNSHFKSINIKDLSVREAEILRKILSYKNDYKEPDKHLIAERLRLDHYNACICTTEWTAISLTGKRYTATYSFIEIVNSTPAEEKLIVDIHFREQFEIAKASPAYQLIMCNFLPPIFIGKEEKLRKIIPVLCSAMVDSFTASGFDDIPPWRRSDYMHSKWLSPNRRTNAV